MATKTLATFACVLVIFAIVEAQDPPKFNFDPPKQPQNDLKLFGQGGGQPSTGYNVNLGAEKKIWESDNRRNTLHGTGTYSQHLGGPYGNSQPNFGGGLRFTHHF